MLNLAERKEYSSAKEVGGSRLPSWRVRCSVGLMGHEMDGCSLGREDGFLAGFLVERLLGCSVGSLDGCWLGLRGGRGAWKHRCMVLVQVEVTAVWTAACGRLCL